MITYHNNYDGFIIACISFGTHNKSIFLKIGGDLDIFQTRGNKTLSNIVNMVSTITPLPELEVVMALPIPRVKRYSSSMVPISKEVVWQ